MIINPLIDALEECIEQGDYSTVESELLRDTVAAMRQADIIINETSDLIDHLEK